MIGKAKKKAAPTQVGLPRKTAAPQATSGPRAHRLNIAIGLDVDNQSHLLGKGPEMNYMKLRDLARDLVISNGLTTVSGKDIQLTSAAIIRPGSRPPKRYKFKPAKAAQKKAPKTKTKSE